MNRFDDPDLIGNLALEDLLDTDCLLDRLGRREPCPGDLDDPVAAGLAVLAGDVDLRPTVAESTRLAMIAAGRWPPQEAWVWREVRTETMLIMPSTTIAAPRAVPAGEIAPGASRSDGRNRLARVQPTFDHPCRLPIRPSVGLAAAAVLVVLGCGVCAAVTSGRSPNPVTGPVDRRAPASTGSTGDHPGSGPLPVPSATTNPPSAT